MSVAPDWCNKFTRIPYLDCGRTRAGVDCYGLYKLVSLEQFRRLVPDYTYTSSMDESAVASTIETYLPCDWRKVDVPEAGDLVMLKIMGRPWHCGVFVAPGLMLHSIGGQVSGIERLDSIRCRNRILGYYRPRVVEAERIAA